MDWESEEPPLIIYSNWTVSKINHFALSLIKVNSMEIQSATFEYNNLIINIAHI